MSTHQIIDATQRALFGIAAAISLYLLLTGREVIGTAVIVTALVTIVVPQLIADIHDAYACDAADDEVAGS